MAFSLKPSLVEWKPLRIHQHDSRDLRLETFLSGMETCVTSLDGLEERPP